MLRFLFRKKEKVLEDKIEVQERDNKPNYAVRLKQAVEEIRPYLEYATAVRISAPYYNYANSWRY